MSNRQTEITPAQTDAIEAMHRACKHTGGQPSVADIARELGVSRTSVYRLLQHAHKKGYITMPETKVVGSYGLTAAGAKLIGAAPQNAKKPSPLRAARAKKK